jgi:hypothetical protein
MAPEVAFFVWIIAIAVFAPGVCLLLLAQFGFKQNHMVALRKQRRVAWNLGWIFVATSSAMIFFIQFTMSTASGSGGLGSAGNPLAAILVLAFAYFAAPLASLGFLGFVAYYLWKRFGITRGR